MQKNKLIIMVGLQGSGKSTWAKKYQKQNNNVVIVSSDEIRRQNPNWENEQVFQRAYLDMNINLSIANTTVVLDATNLTLKSRRKIFDNLKNKELIEVSAVVIATPIDTCIERVTERNKDKNNHYVPIEVVYKYMQSFQIPLKSEGFDSIEFEGNNKAKRRYEDIWKDMIGFDQKNPNHTQTLENHCLSVANLLYDNGLYYKGLLHDYGKLFTQTFDDKGIAHYYGHAEVGAYKLLSEEGDFNTNILAIVNYHMLPYQWNSEKAHTKWKKILGEELYNNLIIFNKADIEAH